MKYLLRKMYVFIGLSIVVIGMNLKYNYFEITFFDKYSNILNDNYIEIKYYIENKFTDTNDKTLLDKKYIPISKDMFSKDSKGNTIYNSEKGNSKTSFIIKKSNLTEKEKEANLKIYIMSEENKQKIDFFVRNKGITEEYNNIGTDKQKRSYIDGENLKSKDKKSLSKENININKSEDISNKETENKNPIQKTLDTVEMMNKQISDLENEIDKIK